MRFSGKQRAFTLIELLVVISIIGTLSSVVLASVSNARIKAETSKLSSEVKNLKNALFAYKLDRGSYPDGFPPPPSYVNHPYRYSEAPPGLYPTFSPDPTLNAGLVPNYVPVITKAISSTYNSEITYCPERCMRAVGPTNTWYCGDDRIRNYFISFNYSKGRGTLDLPKFKYQLNLGPIVETSSYCIAE